MSGTIDFSKIRDDLLSDADVKHEYDELRLPFLIAREIIDWRTRRGLTQQELAELVGTKQSVISRLESGNHLPSLSLLNRVAKALEAEIQIEFTSNE